MHKLYLEDSFLYRASWGHKGTSTDAEKKNGKGISELLSQSSGCIVPTVLKGDHTLRQWTGAIPLSLLSERHFGQRYKGQGDGEMQPCSSLRRLSLSCAPPAFLVLLSLSVYYFAFSLLFPWCLLHSVISSGFSHIHFPIVFSHPTVHTLFLFSFLLFVLSSPSPVQLSKGQPGCRAPNTAVLHCWLHLLTLLFTVYTVGTTLGKQGGRRWLTAEAKRSSVALTTAVCEAGLSS